MQSGIIMKKCYHLCLLVMNVAVILYAQPAVITKTGTTAASFLKIGVGARSIGMGGAYTALSNDISAVYWNPAGLGLMRSTEASFNHVDWIADVKYDNAAVVIVIDGVGSLGLSFTSMNVGEMEVTTTNLPEGTGERFSAGGTLMGISYSKNLTDIFSIGFNVKYIREYVYNESAQTIALDFGTMYVAPVLNGLRLGASVSNFGSKMRLEGRDILTLIKTGAGDQNLINAQYELGSYELPLMFRVGIATDVLQETNNRFTIAIDAVHPNDNTEYINSGVEYSWADIVFLRGGWKSAYERGGEQGLTAGGGIQYELTPTIKFVLDYAYQDFGRLQAVNYFSFGLKF